jgi:hypothetical protein
LLAGFATTRAGTAVRTGTAVRVAAAFGVGDGDGVAVGSAVGAGGGVRVISGAATTPGAATPRFWTAAIWAASTLSRAWASTLPKSRSVMMATVTKTLENRLATFMA